MAKPIDPRLFKQAGDVRTLVVTLGVIAGVRSCAWVGIAFTISTLVVNARDGKPVSVPMVIALGICLLVRPLLAYVAEQIARRQAAQTKHELRIRALTHSATNTTQSKGQITAMLTSGADALDEWFARFLPSALEGALMPVVVIGAITLTDPVSLIVLAVTVPLLGIFGWLIGVETKDQADKQYAAMTRLSGHFLDLLRGLETLRTFGVATAQAHLVRHVADDLRTETMTTLRIAFLSALALELIAMIGTALIAVVIGIRLSYGTMDLLPGLAVLIMAPEAYLPIRRVGATFHASTEGAAAGAALLDAIDADPATTPASGDPSSSLSTPALAPYPTSTPTSWALEGITVVRDGRLNVADASLAIAPGELVALAGQSGSGKSTLLQVLAGLVTPEQGTVRVNGAPTRMEPATPGVVWMPQQPVVLATTVRENLTFGMTYSDAALAEALTRCGAPQLIARLDEPVGQGGSRLSGGEVRRLGLARALLAQPRLLLADEPTTEVDATTAEVIRRTLHSLTQSGVGVLVATHDPELMTLATRTVMLEPLTPAPMRAHDGQAGASAGQAPNQPDVCPGIGADQPEAYTPGGTDQAGQGDTV